jgi:hypothetical protein
MAYEAFVRSPSLTIMERHLNYNVGTRNGHSGIT